MAHYQRVMQIQTRGKSLEKVTTQIQAVVAESGIRMGLCVLFLRHTSASLLIQENADPDVLKDLETFLARLVPEQAQYRHDTEGPDDMPAHIRSALTQTSEAIPVQQGRLLLGTWQGIFFCEFDGPRNRRVYVKVTEG